MSEEEEYSKENTVPNSDGVDEHTTPPHPPASAPSDKVPGKWEMPEPVFQQTSGYLPQGFIQQIESSGITNIPPAVPVQTELEQPAAAALPAVAPAIEPQPDISEQFAVADLIQPVPADLNKKGSGANTAMIILGALGLLLFAILFIVVVYFLFFAGTGR